MTRKQIRYFLLSVTVVLFTACGSSIGLDDPTAQELAFEKIEAYATNGETAPTVQDYIDAGVIGITEENLNEINEVVENLEAQDIDTKEEVQALADELGIVIPTPTPPTPTPTPDTTAPIITITGANPVDVTQGDTYTDAGATAADAVDGTVTVTATGTVDTNTPGSYTITYTATDAATNTSTATRTVTVVVFSTTTTHNGTTYGIVTSPYTGKVWLDKNLGAAQVCETFNDPACYGDYYQWGRNWDGHQESETTTNAQATDINDAGTEFITSTALYDYDWAKAADGDGSLRSGNWSNSVCPIGFRVPTLTELKLETLDNGVIDRDTAFANFLKLPSAGRRGSADGTMAGVGSWGNVWASSVDGSRSHVVYFNTTAGGGNGARANGCSVRCLRD